MKLCEHEDCHQEATWAIIFIDDPMGTFLVCDKHKVEIVDLAKDGVQGILHFYRLH
jgi:hypothetical protein